MEVLIWIFAIALFAVGLAVTVGVHEAAHMWVAKACKISVKEFFIGFGPKLFSRTRGETEYGFRAIPMGGYVQIEDENCDDRYERALLSRVHPAKRIAIFAAGAIVNIVIGLLIFVIMFMVVPGERVTAGIKSVNTECTSTSPCSASESGILPGDTILAINGKEITDGESVRGHVENAETVDLLVQGEDGMRRDVKDIPVVNGYIGITLSLEDYQRGLGEAVVETGGMVVNGLKGIASIPEKTPGVIRAVLGMEKRDPESPGSIVGAGRAYGEIANSSKIDTASKAQMMVVIFAGMNLSIGMLNLVPLNPLDGGKIFFAVVDWVKMGFARVFRYTYKPTSVRVMRWATAIPLSALMFVTLVFILADIIAPQSLGL